MDARQTNLIVFEIGEQRFALSLKHVDKIVDTTRVYFIPGAVTPIKGAISVGQEAVMVVDLSRIFGVPPFFEDSGKVIVMRDEEGRTFGMHIGEQTVLFVWGEDMARAQYMPQRTSNYVAGTVKVGESTLKFLDWRYIYDDAVSRLSERKAS